MDDFGFSIDGGGPKLAVGFWGQYQDFHVGFRGKSITFTWILGIFNSKNSFWVLLKW